MRAFSSFAEGIQGAFVGYSRGIRVQKRASGLKVTQKPRETCGFWTYRRRESDTELAFYNIKK